MKHLAHLFPFAIAAILICCSGCVVHKEINASYATYGLGLQAPPTPVSPPFGLCLGVTKVTYHSIPKDTNCAK